MAVHDEDLEVVRSLREGQFLVVLAIFLLHQPVTQLTQSDLQGEGGWHVGGVRWRRGVASSIIMR